MHEKRHFLSYQKRRHDAQIIWPCAFYVTLGSCCKMANSSSEDETILCPRDPQGYSRISLSLSSRTLKEYRNIVSASKQTPWGLRNRTHWSARYTNGRDAASARLNCINLIHFRLTAGRLRGSSCIVIPGVVCKLLQFAAGIVNFFVDHTHTQFTEESKMATALAPQTDVTSGKVTWLMENPIL